MLLRFSATNFRSVKERQEISFVAAKRRETREVVATETAGGDIHVLPCAIIYGGNASGKSNILNALAFVRDEVLFSHAANTAGESLPDKTFALDRRCQGQPTTLEIDFIVNGIRYEFGFEFTTEAFVGEWLFGYPEGRRRKLYEREGSKISFGAGLKGKKQTIAEFMRPNSLFISTAVQNNHAELTDIAGFFRDFYHETKTSYGENSINNHLRETKVLDTRTIAFLSAIGTGVVGYGHREDEYDDDYKALFKDMEELLDRQVKRRMGEEFGDDADVSVDRKRLTELKNFTLELAHLNDEGEQVLFKTSMESAGTRRLLILLDGIFKALDDGSLVIIDEFDASLHTHAAECIVELFTNRRTNPKGAQLVAATHDTNFLNSKTLRRDEIWFVEKSRVGASEYYSLADIKSVRTDDFEAGYLEGRYGAIPYAGSIMDLWADYLEANSEEV